MAKTINADFQAAPFLGESSFDPNEFMRRYNTTMYQQKRSQQDQNRKDFSAGLKQLELDLDGIYDQQGINEVLGDNNRIKKAAMEAYTKGINVFNPTTAQGMEGNLAVKKALQETMKKVDTIKTNKADLALNSKLRQADEKLPKDEQVYDWDAYAQNLEKIKKNPGSILETQGKLKEALVLNPTIGNVDKLMADSKEYFTPMTVDPVNMTPDPKQLKLRQEEMKKFFRSGKLKPEHIRALEKEKARMTAMNPDNEDLKVMPLDEFFAENYTDKGFLKRSKPNQPKTDTGSGDAFGVKYKPSERQNFRDYTTYHPTLKWPTQNIPTDNIEVWKPNGEKTRPTEKTLQLQYTGYDENTRQATFITESNYYGGGQLGKGDQIAIGIDDLPPEFKEIKLLVNGKEVKIKDAKGDNPAPAKKKKAY